MIAPPEVLVNLCKSWNEAYSHSKTIVTVVMSLHIGGMLLAGGYAISADRATLRALRRPAADRAFTMSELAAVHRWVIGGLAVVVVSGVAQFASDVETFWGSWIFWTKLVLVYLCKSWNEAYSHSKT